MITRMLRGAAALGLLATAGCLNLGPRSVPPVQYFAVEEAPLPKAAPEAGKLPPVRIPPIRAAIYLNERIVWRHATAEAGFYETRRWLDLPGPILERALDRELFERRGFPYGSTLDAHRLEVDLDRFEEVLDPTHEAHVSARVALVDPLGAALFTRTFDAARPVQGDDPAAFAQAMSAAVADLAGQVGDAVAGALRR
jgi:ABC-type uncharacterized transport system auxiliary subunit